MDDGNSDNKKKRKKNLWVRWLSFFQRQFMFKKSKGFDLNKYDENSSNKVENFNDSKIVSCTSSMDIIEIPIQPGQNISKILIKPTKNGVKAMIIQYDRRSLLPLKTKKFLLINDLSKLKKKSKPFINQNAEKIEMTWNYNFKTINGERKEVQKNKKSLMSELYIRQHRENVESTFFVEPRLSNECIKPKKSEDSSQKSVVISRKHISFDEATDEATETFKTVSEPTWKEKEKMFHRQRLQENLNELLEQFILLQSDELITLQSRVKKGEKRIQCDKNEFSFNWTEGNDKRVLKTLSREVSPEILVNIKPFKQYLSGKYLNLQEPPIQFVKKRKRDVTGEQETKMVLKQKCRMQKKSEIHITGKKTEDENLSYHCPVVRSKLQFSTVNNNLKVENSLMKILISDQSTERDTKNENMSFYILDRDLLAGSKDIESLGVTSDDSKARFSNNTDFCSVWGVYKSYANLETVDKKENHVQNKAIDEILDNVDDENHDLVFKKNMAQFKRKIRSKALLAEKNVNLSTKVLEEPEVKEENISIKLTGWEIQDRFILNLKEKKSLTNQSLSITATLQIINLFNSYKQQKTLATYSWFLLGQMEICKTMASRIEVSTIKCPQYFKEIDNLLERNIKAMVEKKLSKASSEETTVLHKRNIKAIGFNSDLQCLLNLKYKAKNCVEITLEDNEFQNESIVLGGTNQWKVTDNSSAFICSKSFLNSTCCPNKLEKFSFTNLEKPGLFKPPKLFLLKILLKETNPEKVKTLNEQNYVNSLKKKRLAFYEIAFRQIHEILHIINDVAVQYHRKEYMSFRPFKNTAKNFLNVDIVKKKNQTSVSPFTSEIFTANASSSNDKIPISKKISNSGNYEIRSQIWMEKALDEKCFMPINFQCGNLIHEVDLSEPIKQKIIGKIRGSKKVNNEFKAKSLVDFKFDGFRILYDSLDKGSLDDYEGAIKTVSVTSFIMNVSSNLFSSEEKEILCTYTYNDNQMNQEISLENEIEPGKDKLNLNKPQEKPSCSFFQELSKTTHNENRSILLKYKSSSSPKENMLKADHNIQEHRMRRSFKSVKHGENFDFYNYKKKRVSAERGPNIRKTGSASLETHFTGKLEKNKSFIASLRKDKSVGTDIKLKSHLIPTKVKPLRETQYKNDTNKTDLKLSVTKIFSKGQKASSPCVIIDKKFFNTKNEKTKMFMVEKNGVNIRKEIVAAFNSIKNSTPCRKETEEGNKQMSLVILLSRNK